MYLTPAYIIIITIIILNYVSSRNGKSKSCIEGRKYGLISGERLEIIIMHRLTKLFMNDTHRLQPVNRSGVWM